MILNFSTFRKVGYPHEHGSWGFFFEPIILALLVAFSTNGILLSLCAFFLFLSYEPISFILKGKPKYLIRSAYFYFFFYSAISIFILFYLYFNLLSSRPLIPFSIAIILMGFFKILELKNFNRNLIVELFPQFAVALMAVSILLIDNWELAYIIGFIIIVLSRSIQTVFYINNKLKFFKGTNPNKRLVNVIGLLFLISLLVFTKYNFAPWSSIIAMTLLMSRSVIGFFEKNKIEKVKIIGIKEFIYGFLFVVINSIGYNFGF